jgi:hypothetical protein
MAEVCDYCGRPFNKASSPSCNRKQDHKVPDTADLIAEDIESDIADRSGIGNEFESYEPAIQQEIRDSWVAIIEKHLVKQ